MERDLSIHNHGFYKIKGTTGLPQWTYHNTWSFIFQVVIEITKDSNETDKEPFTQFYRNSH
jgi:hypothetical protein